MSPVALAAAVVHPSFLPEVSASSLCIPAAPEGYAPNDSSIASRGFLAAVLELPTQDGQSGREFSRRDAGANTGREVNMVIVNVNFKKNTKEKVSL